VARVIEVLDARAARQWAVRALAALGNAREEIDALNVFPVPDGDTGTNLYLTMEAACAAVLALPADAGLRATADSFARGALLGARGNSGIIAAQYLRGWADELGEIQVLDAAAVKRAVTRSDEQAWQAVGAPVEGTILSVSRAAATAARAAGDTLCEVVTAAAQAARRALARTPEQLPVLRRAGVVDAGGRGLVVLWDTLEALVLGRSPSIAPRGHRVSPLPAAALDVCPPDADVDGPAYEVMYLLDAGTEQVGALRARLARLGTSLAVVGGNGLWHVHLHADDPGAAVEAGIEAGRPHQVRITRFADAPADRQRADECPTDGHHERDRHHERDGHQHPDVDRPVPRTSVGLVAWTTGPGLAELFEQAGAVVVRQVPGRRPSTGELLDAVRRAHAEAVVVLPNDPDTLSVARAAADAARQAGLRVRVLPTIAQVQGLAAAAVHDPARPEDDDLVRMSAAAGAARDGAVTLAVRDAITSAGVCRAGDVLGMIQGDVAVVGPDLAAVAGEVVARLLSGGGELVTLVTGQDAAADLVPAVCESIRRTRLDVEVSVLAGGQARYPLLIGVE
jgi:DAK2 domain fusion protein YloV